MMGQAGKTVVLLMLAELVTAGWPSPSLGQLQLGPGEFVQAGGVDVDVPGYSVPSYVDWDGDGRNDLVIGEGGGGVVEGKVRVYLNVGTHCEPQFEGYLYAQSGAADLVLPGGG